MESSQNQPKVDMEVAKEELERLMQEYHTAKDNLTLGPSGGTESGRTPEEILTEISEVCHEIKPGFYSTKEEDVMDKVISILEEK